MTSSGTYSNVTNFAWLIDTLVELTYIAHSLQPGQSAPAPSADLPSLGAQLRDELIDVAARVKQIRPYATRKMAALIQDEDLLESGEAGDAAEVLGAAAWICGEYCRCAAVPASYKRLLTQLLAQGSRRPPARHRIALRFEHDLDAPPAHPRAVGAQWREDLCLVALCSLVVVGRIGT